jgi:NADPH:quinone reductase-like Zn-dependent oxidoreductase
MEPSVAARPASRFPELAALIADGRLTLPILRSYPLAEAAQARKDLEAGRNHGKIVLRAS